MRKISVFAGAGSANTEIVLFTDGEKNIEVQVSPDKETVWLTQKQMEELDNSVVANFATTASENNTQKMRVDDTGGLASMMRGISWIYNSSCIRR